MRTIRRMIMARTLRLAFGGIAIGLTAAWAARSIIASQLYEISALDPLVSPTTPTICTLRRSSGLVSTTSENRSRG